MLAQHCSSVLSTALNSLVAGLTSLKIWSTKSVKKRHLCASISAHSLHKSSPVLLLCHIWFVTFQHYISGADQLSVFIHTQRLNSFDLICDVEMSQTISYSDEERRFMYKINQGHLTVFCIVFVWLGVHPHQSGSWPKFSGLCIKTD